MGEKYIRILEELVDPSVVRGEVDNDPASCAPGGGGRVEPFGGDEDSGDKVVSRGEVEYTRSEMVDSLDGRAGRVIDGVYYEAEIF